MIWTKDSPDSSQITCLFQTSSGEASYLGNGYPPGRTSHASRLWRVHDPGFFPISNTQEAPPLRLRKTDYQANDQEVRYPLAIPFVSIGTQKHAKRNLLPESQAKFGQADSTDTVQESPVRGGIRLPTAHPSPPALCGNRY